LWSVSSPVVVMGLVSCWVPQARVRAGRPLAAGMWTRTAWAAWAMAAGQEVEGGPGGRFGVGSGRSVEADDGVEVDDAPALVFSDFGERDAHLCGQRLGGEPGLAG
jgi:hypothetical protein